mgnify:FL=1
MVDHEFSPGCRLQVRWQRNVEGAIVGARYRLTMDDGSAWTAGVALPDNMAPDSLWRTSDWFGTGRGLVADALRSMVREGLTI